MRALLKDQTDGTLVAFETVEAIYDKEEQRIYLYNPAGTGYQVGPIIEVNAESLIAELFKKGQSEMTDYPASSMDDE